MTESLKHTIKILEKVSFSKDLFIKEVTKAIDLLLPYEIDQLKEWILNFTKNKSDFKEVLNYV
ncbi:hypothetical protein H1R17_13355 [Flavobacterium sp. xlx-214]|uniref:hypothetical protein n=1 Tax=unclassified Flavobacterium TaxID=196869 RepID=UPI0013D6A659|nr:MULTISPECIES: hypothetical protein [unclassified Flavobacterium]MBA5791421.1 hypothetical protein [Flavobacterium sp. xlx-221]QMI83428.1 hypothetical protein H1R17_13355 [Flavobacterium sp. xlx-214]